MRRIGPHPTALLLAVPSPRHHDPDHHPTTTNNNKTTTTTTTTTTNSEVFFLNPNLETGWRLTRVCYLLSVTASGQHELNYLKDGWTAAQKYLEMEGGAEHPHARKWAGIILGSVADNYTDAKQKVAASQQIREHLEFCLTKLPDDSAAQHALGMYCFQVAGISYVLLLLARHGVLRAAFGRSCSSSSSSYCCCCCRWGTGRLLSGVMETPGSSARGSSCSLSIVRLGKLRRRGSVHAFWMDAHVVPPASSSPRDDGGLPTGRTSARDTPPATTSTTPCLGRCMHTACVRCMMHDACRLMMPCLMVP